MDELRDIKELPTWLQKLWELNPALARQAENDYIELVGRNNTKEYKIDFNGHLLAGLKISNNTPKIVGANDGHGYGISNDDILITRIDNK